MTAGWAITAAVLFVDGFITGDAFILIGGWFAALMTISLLFVKDTDHREIVDTSLLDTFDDVACLPVAAPGSYPEEDAA